MPKSISDFFRFLRTDSGTKRSELRNLPMMGLVDPALYENHFCKLRCITGEHEGHIFTLYSNDIIGRDMSSSICLRHNQLAARRHCVLHCKGDKWFVECCGLNGVIIDDIYCPSSQEKWYPIETGITLQIIGKEYNDEFKVIAMGISS